MKKIYLFYLIGLSFILHSCSDLDQLPMDSIDPSIYFKTENDLKLYTNSFYNMLPSAEGVYNESVDNIIKSSISSEVQGTRSVPTSGGGWSWGNLRNINFYLERSINCPDEKARNRYDAVARFFRAYFYFDMVKQFGDVPWYDKVILETDTEALTKSRDSRTIVVDKIIADLDFAIANLSEKKMTNEISKWTALALKSRICLFEGTFRKYHPEFKLAGAETLLDQSIAASALLIEKSGYSIYSTDKPESDYLNLFAAIEPIETEIILSRNFSDGLQVYHNVNYYTMTASYGKPGLEKRLVNTYLMKDGSRFTDKAGYATMIYTEEVKDRDLRLSQTIRTPGYTRIGETETLVPEFGSTVTGYQLIKFVAGRQYDTYNKACNAMPIFRYAEILLNYAEAKAERGTLTQQDIDKSIKLLRDRVRMPNLILTEANTNPDPYLVKLYPAVSGSNKGVLLEIRRERSIELVMENFRWDDIIRWKAASILAEQFKGMYFPSVGAFDLDGDSKPDVCIYEKTKPNLGNIQYLKLNSDIKLENGTSGNIVVNPQIKKKWDENKDYLYPIPIQERLLNKNLTQNPGWEDGVN
ncbi:RagB/SusD family nutrient uptake outer membrane protein [Dysgonomonas sp. Marseille-P4677]|uniref:RagB/SusD family nutrient uptake outer membrane protein n=1 Tax=Dysgonomonas sp. Marseille-P4677 TaxID=2364790 RepID=UPI0019116284|nr:RagB/SusD family nutrient uptake outer membrane protein [Dysgonomonas sp. Marseille-P4677]MBK5722436.1 RagB/SusD family nutrient uptake outer membrane protein [Dysgonomonas sp. Marseille-P4677]